MIAILYNWSHRTKIWYANINMNRRRIFYYYQVSDSFYMPSSITIIYIFEIGSLKLGFIYCFFDFLASYWGRNLAPYIYTKLAI